LRAIRDLEVGRAIPNVIRSDEANRFPHLTVVPEVIGKGKDWQTHWENKLATLKALSA
jgi:hypothetical protein